MCYRWWRITLFVAVLISGFAASPLYAQQANESARRIVVLTQLTTSSNDVVAEKLAETITNSIDLVLRLTNSVQLRRADFLLPTQSISRSAKYYRHEGAAAAVFGSVDVGSDGSYEVNLDIWNAATSNAKRVHVLQRRISNLLDSFSLADRLSLEVASSIVGRRLSDGTLVVENTGNLPSFSVYADRHLLGRERTSFKVLTGKREIVVAKPGILGDQALQAFHVTIRPNQTTVVRLGSQPAPAPEIKLPSSGAINPKARGTSGLSTEKRRAAETPTPGTASAVGSGRTAAAPSTIGSVIVTTKTGGFLFVDGKERQPIMPDTPVTIDGLSPSPHKFTVIYHDGKTESVSISSRATTGRTPVKFVYVPNKTKEIASGNRAAARHAEVRAHRAPRSYVGFDIAEALLLGMVSSLQTNNAVYFDTFELDNRWLLRGSFGLATDLLVRVNYAPVGVPPLKSWELAAALGPALFFGRALGPFLEVKVGVGYAWGSYDNAPYSRLDLLLQPELGLTRPINDHLTLTVGFGVQSLLPIREQPVIPASWWGQSGELVQHFLPVLDLSLGWQW